jgi:hypothetical protein
MGAAFTGISLIRSYALRRLFEVNGSEAWIRQWLDRILRCPKRTDLPSPELPPGCDAEQLDVPLHSGGVADMCLEDLPVCDRKASQVLGGRGGSSFRRRAMSQEEADHFPGGIRTGRISIAAGSVATRPGVSGPDNDPVLDE